MKIEKFLELISNNPKVEKIYFYKPRGYVINLKEGYGVVEICCHNYYLDENKIVGKKINVISFLNVSRQKEVEEFLDKVTKLDIDDIMLKDKNFKKEAFEKMDNILEEKIVSLESNIKREQLKIEEMNKTRNKIKDLI